MNDEPEENKEILVEKVRELENRKKRSAPEDRENTSKVLGEKTEYTPAMSDDEARKLMQKYSRRGFLIAGASAVFGYLGYQWLRQPEQDWIFRRNLEFNERVSGLYYSSGNKATEFSREQIGNLRVNGGEGMSGGFSPEKWKLQVIGLAEPKKYPQYVENIAYEAPANDENSNDQSKGEPREGKDAKQSPNEPQSVAKQPAATDMQTPGLLLNLDEIKSSLPRVEMITELKCIEGWSTIVHWAGVRFSDFMAKFAPPAQTKYVSLVTPDGGYYVGMDLPSMTHPQTLLAYEMNYASLTVPHGAPLRLVTTTKYGIKQIKRIGRIVFTDERPADFWGERGYDWYAGL